MTRPFAPLTVTFLGALAVAGCGTPATPRDAGAGDGPLVDAHHADAPATQDTIATDTPAALDTVTTDTPAPVDSGPGPDVATHTDVPVVPTDASVITPGDPGTSDVHFAVSSVTGVAAISPYIYGLNAPDWTSDHNVPLTRQGGNRMTAYNWENNASNAGSDYMFQNDNLLCSGTGCDQPGETVRRGVDAAFAHNASVIVTVPMAGYVSADTGPGGDVRASGAGYLSTRFRVSVPRKGSAFTLTPSTTDANVYQDEFVHWVTTTYPTSATDPVHSIFYSLDNEPDLWSSTHAEIHPAAVTYAEMVSRTTALAGAIKAVVPSGLVFGFVSYGWAGYTTLQSAPDAAGRDFIDFFLDAMHTAEGTAGHRLLDVLDLHWYPEATGDGQRITGSGTTAGEVDARVQAPRSLWDASYVETSWITGCCSGGAIRLIPRMRDKIAAHYPGTRLSISEYNYGGGADISGGVAEADVLGVFGREGLFAATEWPLVSDESYIHAGLAMFRDYDGANGAFGNTSIAATSSDNVRTSVYASVDAGHPERMVLVAINKSTASVTAGIAVTHTARFSHAEVYQLTSAGASPHHAADVPITAVNAFRYAMPAHSVTTLVLRP